MIELNILYGKPFDTTWQKKSFKDETSAVQWCRKNHEKIGCINDYRTFFAQVSHFDIMDAIRGKAK